MKQTIYKLTFLFILSVFATCSIYAQPAPWDSAPSSTISGVLQASLTINSINAEIGDYIAAFTPTGGLAGVAPIVTGGGGPAYFTLVIMGNDDTNTDLMNAGEDFTLQAWDSISNTYYSVGDPAALIGPWMGTNQSPKLLNLEMDNVPITNGWLTLNVDASSILPIKLSKFEVTNYDCGKTSIDWTTSTEVNNDYFTLQRSIDGLRSFKDIAEIKGSGTSFTSQHYTFEDNFSKPGKYNMYYRLKQTDYDGRSTTTEVISSRQNCSFGSKLITFPNPFSNDLNIKALDASNSIITIYNAQGKTMFEKSLKEGQQDIFIDTQLWSEGMYIIRQLSNDIVMDTQKILKQN